MGERTGEYLTNRDHGDETPALPPGRAPGEIGVIVSTPGVVGGAARIAGTRIPVGTVYAWHRAGHDTAAIIREYPSLTPADVAAAIAHIVDGPRTRTVEIGAADDERPGRPAEAQLEAWARLEAAATEGPWLAFDRTAEPDRDGDNWDITDDPHWTVTTDHLPVSMFRGPAVDYPFIAAARTAMPLLLAYVASLRETLAFALTERQEWRRRAEDRAVAHRADIDRLVALEAEAARLRALDPLARAALTYLGTFDEVVEEQISVNHLAVAGGRSRDTDRRMTARHEQVFALRAVLRDAIAALTPEQRAELEASDGG